MKKISTLILGLFLIHSISFSQAPCGSLFISEYIEGSSNNKALEIYNPTNSTIDLAPYQIRTYFNGATTFTSFDLLGSIAPGGVHVVAHSSALSDVTDFANQTINGGALDFNGDDAIELFDGTNVIDVIGIVGIDPGTSWTIDGITPATQNRTIVRKNTVKSGTTTWTGVGDTQWDIHPQDDFTFLGAHRMKPCIIIPLGGDPLCLGDELNIAPLISGGQAPYNVMWDMDNGDMMVGPVLSYTYPAAGSYNIMIMVTDSDSEFEVEFIPVTINVNPNIAMAILTEDIVCPPANSELCYVVTVMGAEPYTVDWSSHSGGFESSNNTNCSNYNTSGEDTLFLTVTHTGTGCQSHEEHYFVIPDVPDASFNYGMSTYCISDTDPVPASITTAGGTFSSTTATVDATTGEVDLVDSGADIHIIEYEVSDGTCSNSSIQTVFIISGADVSITGSATHCINDASEDYSGATAGGTWTGTGILDAVNGTFDPSVAGVGTHKIYYEITGSCGNIDSLEIEVFDIPTAVFTYSVTSPGVLVLTNTSTGASSIEWSITEGGTTINPTENIYTYLYSSNEVEVCITATNSDGCEDTDCQTIGSLSTNSIKKEFTFSIYPNPANNIVNIQFGELNSNGTIQIYNVLGELVLNVNFNESDTYKTINVNDLSNGTYFIQLNSSNQQITKKLHITK